MLEGPTRGNRNQNKDGTSCEDERRKGRMTNCSGSVNGKSKPWRICRCCYSEEEEVNDIVTGVQPSGNGFTPSEQFAPVEHPLEPPDIDKPARCPAPEPCIVHDGRIWKERVAIARKRLDMAKGKDESMVGRRRSL